MAHLLLIETPGGNDFDLLEEALTLGHEVSFFTADLSFYESRGFFAKYLSRAKQVIEVKPFDYQRVEHIARQIHHQDPFQALLCLIDIRIIEAARLAACLKLPFLNAASAARLRNKFRVRKLLSRHGIHQPAYEIAESASKIPSAVKKLGLPALVKPVDGYGSQNILVLKSEDDLLPFIDTPDGYLPEHADYGLGVQASGKWLVEKFINGQLIACDTFSQDGKHVLLGINEKLMYPSPSCAIKGSCFPSNRFNNSAIESYAFSVLDALEFNCGAAHIEMILTKEGPCLVEVNPRLVGAKLPRLINAALGRSIHKDLIDLHLGKPILQSLTDLTTRFAISRWVVASEAGHLRAIALPPSNSFVFYYEMLKQPGDYVSPPYENADRIGYVITASKDRAEAEKAAEDFVSVTKLTVDVDCQLDLTRRP
jgi:cysteine synthase A